VADYGPRAVSGGNTYNRFMKLISRGGIERCSRTGNYFYRSDTVSDGKGGRISKDHDVYVHDQLLKQSRLKGGLNWQRGAKK